MDWELWAGLLIAEALAAAVMVSFTLLFGDLFVGFVVGLPIVCCLGMFGIPQRWIWPP